MQTIVDPAETEELEMSAEDGGKGQGAAPPGGMGSLKVMVIDDSKTIRRTAETLLKKEGCNVVTASDGFEMRSRTSSSSTS